LNCVLRHHRLLRRFSDVVPRRQRRCCGFRAGCYRSLRFGAELEGGWIRKIIIACICGTGGRIFVVEESGGWIYEAYRRLVVSDALLSLDVFAH
jgi:hypothetical protein